MRLFPSLTVFLCLSLFCLALPAGALAHDDMVSADQSTLTPRLTLAPEPRTLGLERTPWSDLPTEWCGQATTSNRSDGADAVRPQVKFLYAVPTDRQNRLAEVANGLQASASTLAVFLARNTAGQKTIRFDLGSSCGEQYLDIQSLALSKPSAAYMKDGHGSVEALQGDLNFLFRTHLDGPRIFVVVVEGLQGTLNGESWTGMAKGNGAMGLSSVYLPNQLKPRVGHQRALMARTILHEVSHSLGAVSNSAPFSDGTTHCRQDEDVMCSGNAVQHVLQCPGSADNGPVWTNFDCGGDDYFNPSPKAGSWLAGHADDNIYYAPYFAPCAELPGQCQPRAYFDADTDGLEDSVDRCPNQAGVGTSDGCPGPAPTSQRQTVSLPGNAAAGYFEGTVTPGATQYAFAASAQVALPKGTTTLKLCLGARNSAGNPSGTLLRCKTSRVKLKAPATREVRVQRSATKNKRLPAQMAVSLKLTGSAKYSGKLAVAVSK